MEQEVVMCGFLALESAIKLRLLQGWLVKTMAINQNNSVCVVFEREKQA